MVDWMQCTVFWCFEILFKWFEFERNVLLLLNWFFNQWRTNCKLCLIWVWFNFVNYESWSSNAWGDDIGIVTVMSLPSSWWRDQSIYTGFVSFLLQLIFNLMKVWMQVVLLVDLELTVGLQFHLAVCFVLRLVDCRRFICKQ